MTEEEKVLAVNQRFYAALEKLDLEEMEAIWLHVDWVKCVHPGWEMLEGWEEVRESWQRIFENTRLMRVFVSDLRLHVENHTAWVVCVENVTSSYETGFEQVSVQVTNLFVLSDGEWRMVHHHASPLPPRRPTTVQ